MRDGSGGITPADSEVATVIRGGVKNAPTDYPCLGMPGGGSRWRFPQQSNPGIALVTTLPRLLAVPTDPPRAPMSHAGLPVSMHLGVLGQGSPSIIHRQLPPKSDSSHNLVRMPAARDDR
eukprot:gene22480-29603_t